MALILVSLLCVLAVVLGFWVYHLKTKHDRPKLKRAHARPLELISDLDALITQSVAFRFDGEIHEIKPITVVELLEFYRAFSSLEELNKASDQVSVSELVEAYATIIASVCPSITKRHIKNMTQAQVGALFQLVMDSVVGKAHAKSGVEPEDAKKKPQAIA